MQALPVRLLALLLVAPALAGAGGCCAGGNDYLSFGIGGAGTTTPLWGDTMEWPGREIVVSYPDHRELAGEPIEVYRDGERVTIPVQSLHIDNSTRMGCGYSYDRIYDLADLETDLPYEVVHRRRTGTGDPINCSDDCPWTTYDGDEALVMILVLTDPPATE